MNVKNFINGVAFGALQIREEHINKELGYQWTKEGDYWTLHIHHYRAFTLDELIKAKDIVNSFCECKDLVVGNGWIRIVVDMKEGGGE